MVMSASIGTDSSILIVEDDPETAEVVSTLLTSHGYRTTLVDSGHAALALISDNFDLVLLDLNLPDISGLDILRYARAHSYVMPMIVLSGYGRDVERVQSLEEGADDYMSKPFTPEELVARVRAILRRMAWFPRPETRLQVRQLELDIPRRQGIIRGERFHLTPTEYGILAMLMRRAGDVVSYDQILMHVWGDEYRDDYSVLRVNISRLRVKIEEKQRHSAYIVTVPGVGYYMPTASRQLS